MTFMKIAIKKLRATSPFTSTFSAENKAAKRVLGLLEKENFDSRDIYLLQKLGFEIELKK